MQTCYKKLKINVSHVCKMLGMNNNLVSFRGCAFVPVSITNPYVTLDVMFYFQQVQTCLRLTLTGF